MVEEFLILLLGDWVNLGLIVNCVFLRLFLMRWLRFLLLFFEIFTDLVLIIIIIYRKKYELLINLNLCVDWYETYLTTSKGVSNCEGLLHSIQLSNKNVY